MKIKELYSKTQTLFSNKVSFYSFILVELLILFLNVIFFNCYFGLMAAVIFVIYLFFSSFEKKTQSVVILSFFTSLFKISVIQSSLFSYCLILYIVFCFLFFKNQKQWFLFLIIYSLFHLFSLFLPYFFISFRNFSIIKIFSSFTYFAFGTFVLLVQCDKKTLISMLILGFLASVLVSLPSIFSSSYATNLYNIFYGKDSFPIYQNIGNFRVLRFSGLAFDPNHFAFLCLFISLLIVVNRKSIYSYYGIPYFIYAIIMNIFGLLSFSKMHVVFLLLIALFYSFMFVFKLFKSKQYIYLLIITITLIVVIALAGPTLFAIVFSRLLDELKIYGLVSLLDSLSTYRFSLAVLTVDEIMSNPIVFLFGKGITNSTIELETHSAHFMLVQLILTRGVIGSLIYFFPFLFFFCKCAPTRSISIERIFFVIVVCLCSCSLPLDTFDKITLLLSVFTITITNSNSKTNTFYKERFGKNKLSFSKENMFDERRIVI